MDGLKRIFRGIDKQYMVRAYILGAIFYAIMLTFAFAGHKPAAQSAVLVVFGGICTLLFPFAKLVWDQLKTMALGQTVLILPIIFLYPAKILVNALLWSLALFIAPFGMAYIWFQTRAA